MWIDLIGFDNKQPDSDVKRFLDSAGFIPDANLFRRDAGTSIKRCIDGIMPSLGAGITKTEWAWIKKRYDSGFAADPELVSGGAKLLSNKDEVNIMTVEMKKGLRRVFLWNNKNVYGQPRIDVGAEIKSIRAVTDFPVMPVIWTNKIGDEFYKGSFFFVTIPPKGMVVLDVAVRDARISNKDRHV